MQKILRFIYKFRVFKRLLPSLLKLYIKIFKNNKIIIKYENIYLQLNLLNPIDREIYLKGKYENDQINYLIKKIKENEIKYFIDIGAHMGFYSMKISKNNIETYAFEPIYNNFKQLNENKNLNKLNNIKIFNFALSNIEQDVEMWVPDKNKTGGYSIYDVNDREINNYNPKKINKIKTNSKIGDNILKIRDKKIAVKIDVERHELKVLEGLNEFFKNNKIILQIELFEERQTQMITYLSEKKYQKINNIGRDFYFQNF